MGLEERVLTIVIFHQETPLAVYSTNQRDEYQSGLRSVIRQAHPFPDELQSDAHVVLNTYRALRATAHRFSETNDAIIPRGQWDSLLEFWSKVNHYAESKTSLFGELAGYLSSHINLEGPALLMKQPLGLGKTHLDVLMEAQAAQRSWKRPAELTGFFNPLYPTSSHLKGNI